MKKIKILIICSIAILQCYGQTAKVYFEEGIKKETNRDYTGAIKDFTNAIKLDSTFSQAYYKRAYMLFMNSKNIEAVNDLDVAIKLNPNGNADAYLLRAILYTSESGNDDVIIFVCSKAIKINPKLWGAYLLRGKSKSNLQNYKSALEDFDKAIEINPNNDDAYFQRGKTKAELNNALGAIVDFTKTIQLNPKNSDAYLLRGDNKNTLEDYRGAITDYTIFIERIPKYFPAYLSRGLSKNSLEDYRGAISDYSRVIEINPEYGDAYYLRGRTKIYLNDKNSGCLDLSRAGELGNKDAYDAIKKYCN